MARTRDRSPSADPGDVTHLAKRLKTSHVAPPQTTAFRTPSTTTKNQDDARNDPTAKFANALFDHNHIARLHTSYDSNQPFKYAVVDKLFQEELLKKVKDEILSELSFTEKETDIYKVNQTGDLASLNYLAPDQLSRLPSLLTLRDSLYSPKFRQFLRSVTGCGPLSGKKQDMSVNSYTRGCHLLNHDDVIGSRRVSYILYLPLPHYQMWQKDWGGALELYPVKPGKDGQLEPESIPSKSIPPSWNQFIFFEVQPGRSFHSVEEVVVGDGRERLSISGWFHAAQEGEEGFVPEAPSVVKSSREQLASTSTVFTEYPESSQSVVPEKLSDDHVAFLSEFLNPVYLQSRTMKALANRFVEESSLELHSFLSNEISENLETRLRNLDLRDGLGEDRAGKIPPHNAGAEDGWAVRGPPHKWRYCHLKARKEGAPVQAVAPRAANPSADAMMRSLQEELFSSPAFRAWLSLVTRLIPMRHSVEARRFRPGLDYSLATSEDSEARLDVVLGLTPRIRDPDSDEESTGYYRQQPASRGWQSAEWGGWECYMAPHNEEDDPAVYRSSVHKKAKPTNGHSNGHTNGHSNGDVDEDEESMGSEEEDEEDSTLLTVQPGFNRLLLVLRDERVMRFVKYVSAAAEGSRWDVCGEYEVGMIQADDDDDDDSS
ncbi:nuclear protein [Coprinopsis marcescibilis]|uniref:uS12 prolyl 3,4-dihydroxylase n=1 Tax=Coprinopsis marcescibilis TaxID=230819 RepID=A0A5C3L859_COPMA|nr:nuclear protein [Coprinopsis marcescibilis]